MDTMTWWTELYDDVLADVLLVREDEAEVEATVDFLHRHLRLRPGDAVFDQCCGIGSLSLPLARRGLRCFGVDLMPSYIDRARRAAQAAYLPVSFEVGDAFEHVTPERCHGAFNWWTSFGYAEDDLLNGRMLACAWHSLAPGGSFALDTMNAPGVLRSFRRDIVIRRDASAGEVLLWRRTDVDLARGRLLKRWTYFYPDGRRIERPSSVRLYMPHELLALMASAGFVDVRCFGDLNDAPLDLDSPRCIVVGRKPEG